jgi:AAA domain
MDFGGNKGYSPIQLVMVCLSLPFGEAVDWLKNKLSPERENIEVDYEALKSAGTAGEQPKQENKTEDGTAKASPARKIRFKLTPYREMKPGLDQSYLVDELFPAKGIVVVWSPPKNYKSFAMLSVGLHVAMGWKYCGRAVHQGLVLYCAFEGGHKFSNRIEAQRRYYDLTDDQDIPMPVLKGMANLISDHKLMIDEFKYQLQGTRPVAVILDTLNRSFVGSESKDADMANYVRAAEAIRDAFDCVVIIVHHTGWDESRMRGHSSLPAAVDAELSLAREGDMATLEVKHMRDGVEGTQVVLRAKSIDIGEDANGKEQTSLVLIPADPEDVMPSSGQPKQTWPRSLKIFQRAVSESMSGAGFEFEGGARTVRAVELRHVRDKFFRSYLADGDDAKRMAWKRALDTAQQRRLISAQSDGKREIVWFTAQEQVDDGYAF